MRTSWGTTSVAIFLWGSGIWSWRTTLSGRVELEYEELNLIDGITQVQDMMYNKSGRICWFISRYKTNVLSSSKKVWDYVKDLILDFVLNGEPKILKQSFLDGQVLLLHYMYKFQRRWTLKMKKSINFVVDQRRNPNF